MNESTHYVLAEWALRGKEPTDTGYRLLRWSHGLVGEKNFDYVVSRYSPGDLTVFPQVTVSWLRNELQNQYYLALAIHKTQEPASHDAGGREIVYTSYYCIPYDQLKNGPVPYSLMYECFRSVSLPTEDRLPIPARLGVLGSPALPDARAMRVAALLLTGRPVCILRANHLGETERLRFIDMVSALLPYGMRCAFSASTMTSGTNRSHNFRLFFSTADRAEGDHVVSWDDANTDLSGYDIANEYLAWLSGDGIKRRIAQLAMLNEPRGFKEEQVRELLGYLKSRSGRWRAPPIYRGLRILPATTLSVPTGTAESDEAGRDPLDDEADCSDAAAGEDEDPQPAESRSAPTREITVGGSLEPVVLTGEEASQRFSQGLSQSGTPRPSSRRSLEDLLAAVAADLNEEEDLGHRLGDDLQELHHYRRSEISEDARQTYLHDIKHLGLLDDHPDIESDLRDELYTMLLRLFFGQRVNYDAYCDIERCLDLSDAGILHASLATTIMATFPVTDVPRFLMLYAVDDGKLMRELSSRASSDLAAKAAEQRLSPEHSRIIYTIVLASLTGAGNQRDIHEVERAVHSQGYFAQTLERIYPDDRQIAELKNLLTYLYGTGLLARLPRGRKLDQRIHYILEIEGKKPTLALSFALQEITGKHKLVTEIAMRARANFGQPGPPQ